MGRVLVSSLAAALAVLLVAATAGCSAIQQAAPVTVQVAAAAPAKAGPGNMPMSQLDLAINDFGLDLLGELTARDTGNVVISPVSVHDTLAMTMNGAAGTTAEQMGKVLALDPARLAESNAAYAQLLARVPRATAQPNENETPGTIRLANALFADPKVAFSPEFLAADRDYFGAQIASLDFASPGAAKTIDSWVSSQTAGKIDHIWRPTLDPTVLALANAAYFKNDWQTPFKAEDTKPEPFHLSDGTTVQVPMMHGAEQITGVETTMFVAARIPYKVLGPPRRQIETSMWVFVPKPGTDLASLDREIAPWLASQSSRVLGRSIRVPSRSAILTMPTFHTSYDADLKPSLSAMGMPVAFDQVRADFAKMAGIKPLWIGSARHKAWIDVDEKGTEAAAATVVQMTLGSASGGVSSQPLEVNVDRPFIFAITNETDGYVMFVGAIRDPRR